MQAAFVEFVKNDAPVSEKLRIVEQHAGQKEYENIMLKEAKEVFKNTKLAYDLLEIEVK